MVTGKGLDDPEREKMIEYVLARSNPVKTNPQKEVLRVCSKAEEERVDDDERIAIRGVDIDKFKALMLKEKADLTRLDEESFEHLVAQLQARDAKHLEAVNPSRGSDEADEGVTRFKPAGFHGSFAVGLSLYEQIERSLPIIPQLRGGEEHDQDAEPHQSSLAASTEPEEAQPEKTAPAAAAAAAAAEDRLQRLQDEYEDMVYRTKACDIEREARVEVAQRRALREKAVRTSGFASDEAFENMRALQEVEECNLVEMMKRQRQEVCSSDTDGSEEAVLNKSAEQELSRRKTCTEAERSYLLPPASPPKYAPPPYTAAEFEFEEVGGSPSQSDSVTRGGMRGGHATPLDDNPGALLAELASLREGVQRSGAEIDNTVLEGDDVGHMLAEFDSLTPSTHATATAYDNPREMLEELLTLSAPDPRELRSPTSEDFEEIDDDIDAFRARLEGLRIPSGRSMTPAPASFGSDEGRGETIISGDLPSEVIPRVIALELELSGCEWAVAQGWTRWLFGSGLISYEAQKEKEIAVAHAEEALRRTIASVMKVEGENRRKDEETKLQRRLIVSNLAAGADVGELKRRFWQYRSDIVNITMLPDRDALKRTQTAYVDFCSRKSAVQASFLSSQIYGLIFDVKLAVPVDDGCGRCV